MNTIVITEKSSQAKNIRKAIGNTFGEIYPLAGHVIEFLPPDKINEAYKTWGYDLIFPTKKVPTKSKANLIKPIREALKKADTVIVASDCDREGTLLVRELLDYLNYKKKGLRAVFRAEDPKSIKAAFDSLIPLSETDNEYSAGVARQTADYALGMSLTRAISVKTSQTYAIGRVKTPTLALIVGRENQIANFKSEKVYKAIIAIGDLELHSESSKNKQAIEQLLSELPDTCVLQKTVENKKDNPPKPFDLLSLTNALSHLSAKKVLDVAQSLYETHKIITYPRSENRHLPENLIDESISLSQRVANLYSDKVSDLTDFEPVIYKGKNGVFFDAESSHFGIIPNVNIDFENKLSLLDADESKMFDIISRQFLASMMKPAEYQQTVYTTTINQSEYTNQGKVYTKQGYRAILNKKSSDKDLPDIAEGEQAISGSKMHEQDTKPPARYTEASLGTEMKMVYKYVKNPDLKAMLKAANGIGTQSTRANLIDALRETKYFTVVKNKIHATPKAINLITELKKVAPTLTNPIVTAQWERDLDLIESGQLSSDEFIEKITDSISNHLSKIENSDIEINREVSKKQIDLVKKLCSQHKISLPDLNDYKAVKETIDDIFSRVEAGELSNDFKPSTKQVSYAKKLAKKSKRTLTKEELASAQLLSKAIDEMKENND